MIGASWVHLRMYETCGHIGCCDQSPNRHSRAHFHSTSTSDRPLGRRRARTGVAAASTTSRSCSTRRELARVAPGRLASTKDTLHLYSQILGKIRLATTAPRNHWWNVPLYVDVRGLTTRRLHHRGTTFEIALDFVDHALVVQTADGRTGSFELGERTAGRGLRRPPPRAARRARHRRRDQGGAVRRADDDAVPQDTEHASWDRDAIERFGRVLDWSDSGVRGVQRLVQRQDQPGPPLLAQPRPRRHPLLRAGRACRSTPIRSPRRPTRTRSSRSASGPATTRSATPPTTPTPRPSPRGSATSRCRRASGSSSAVARWRSFPTRRVRTARTRGRRCWRSARAPTRPARASPAGTPAQASSRVGVRRNSGESCTPTAAADLGRPLTHRL